ncbi:MAG: adenosylcobinamide-GDP ribazoletransferase [Ramlibacter sp.]|nr:adenosylcobinamide-GDP ribazoletransferase [Ramlibacter sp.]
MGFLRHYLIAVRSFTRVPVTGTLAQWIGASPDMQRASAAHFPGVGWLVGIVACAAFALVGLALPGNPFAPLVAAVACTAATVLLTGGFHESGLARAADGLGTDVPAARALEIMKDSHIGSFGAIALTLGLLAKVSLLAVLAARSPSAVLVGLLAAHVISRFWPLLLVRAMPYLGDARTRVNGPLNASIDSGALGIAAAWSLAALAIAVLAQGLAFAILGVLFSGLALMWMRRLFSQRLQGFTDECLGATQQACEIAFYLGAAIGWGGR